MARTVCTLCQLRTVGSVPSAGDSEHAINMGLLHPVPYRG